MTKRRTLALAITITITVLLGGCAASGARYAEDSAKLAPVPAEAARLTIYRPGGVQYAARSAALKLDGEKVGGLAVGGFRIVEVTPGRHTLEVDMWDAPGRCRLSFEAPQGSVSYFEVAPRLANLAAGTPGSLVPVGVVASTAVSVAGEAIESAGRQCGGAFSVVPVEPSAALAKLEGLRASR